MALNGNLLVGDTQVTSQLEANEQLFLGSGSLLPRFLRLIDFLQPCLSTREAMYDLTWMECCEHQLPQHIPKSHFIKISLCKVPFLDADYYHSVNVDYVDCLELVSLITAFQHIRNFVSSCLCVVHEPSFCFHCVSPVLQGGSDFVSATTAMSYFSEDYYFWPETMYRHFCQQFCFRDQRPPSIERWAKLLSKRFDKRINFCVVADPISYDKMFFVKSEGIISTLLRIKQYGVVREFKHMYDLKVRRDVYVLGEYYLAHIRNIRGESSSREKITARLRRWVTGAPHRLPICDLGRRSGYTEFAFVSCLPDMSVPKAVLDKFWIVKQGFLGDLTLTGWNLGRAVTRYVVAEASAGVSSLALRLHDTYVAPTVQNVRSSYRALNVMSTIGEFVHTISEKVRQLFDWCRAQLQAMLDYMLPHLPAIFSASIEFLKFLIRAIVHLGALYLAVMIVSGIMRISIAMWDILFSFVENLPSFARNFLPRFSNWLRSFWSSSDDQDEEIEPEKQGLGDIRFGELIDYFKSCFDSNFKPSLKAWGSALPKLKSISEAVVWFTGKIGDILLSLYLWWTDTPSPQSVVEVSMAKVVRTSHDLCYRYKLAGSVGQAVMKDPDFENRVLDVMAWDAALDDDRYRSSKHKLQNTLCVEYTQAMNALRPIYVDVLRRQQLDKERPVPFWIHFYGRTGEGKSLSVKPFCEMIHDQMWKQAGDPRYSKDFDFAQQVFNLNELDQYFDKMRGEPLAYADDLFQSTQDEVVANTAQLLINLISPIRYEPLIADMTMKGKRFDVDFLVSTGNDHTWPKLMIKRPEALHNRVALKVCVDRGDDGVVRYKPTIEERDIHRRVVRSFSGPTNPDGYVTLEDLAAVCVHAYLAPRKSPILPTAVVAIPRYTLVGPRLTASYDGKDVVVDDSPPRDGVGPVPFPSKMSAAAAAFVPAPVKQMMEPDDSPKDEVKAPVDELDKKLEPFFRATHLTSEDSKQKLKDLLIDHGVRSKVPSAPPEVIPIDDFYKCQELLRLNSVRNSLAWLEIATVPQEFRLLNLLGGKLGAAADLRIEEATEREKAFRELQRKVALTSTRPTSIVMMFYVVLNPIFIGRFPASAVQFYLDHLNAMASAGRGQASHTWCAQAYDFWCSPEATSWIRNAGSYLTMRKESGSKSTIALARYATSEKLFAKHWFKEPMVGFQEYCQKRDRSGKARIYSYEEYCLRRKYATLSVLAVGFGGAAFAATVIASLVIGLRSVVTSLFGRDPSKQSGNFKGMKSLGHRVSVSVNRGPAKVVKMSIPRPLPQADESLDPTTVLDPVIAKVRANMRFCNFNGLSGYLLGIVSGLFLTPTHLLQNMTDGTSILISPDGFGPRIVLNWADVTVYGDDSPDSYSVVTCSKQISFKDIRNHFTENVEHNVRIRRLLPIIKDNIQELYMHETSEWTHLDTPRFHGCEGEFMKMPNGKGYCGIPYFYETRTGLKIAYIHGAGDEQHRVSFGHFVNRHIVQTFVDLHLQQTGTLVAPEVEKFDGSSKATPVLQCGKVFTPGTILMGKLPPGISFHNRTDSSLVKTTLHPNHMLFPMHDENGPIDLGFEPTRAPANLSPDGVGGGLNYPLHKYAVLGGEPNTTYSIPDSLSHALPMDEMLPPGFSTRNTGWLTLQEAILGGDGVESLELKQSVGYPDACFGKRRSDLLFLPGTKQIRPEFIAKMDHLEDTLSRGVYRMVGIVFSKDELIDIPDLVKGKSRSITMGELTYVVMGKRLFHRALKALEAQPAFTACATGFNPHGKDPDILYSRLASKSKNTLAGDQTGQERTIPCPWEEEYIEWWDNILPLPPKQTTIRANFVRSVVRPYLMVFGRIFWCPLGSGSGHPLTQHFASWSTHRLHRMCWRAVGYKDEDFKANVEGTTLGDDSLYTVTPQFHRFNMINLSTFAASIGIRYTTPTKGEVQMAYIPLDEATFLKRRFERRESFMTMPLKISSIYESVMYEDKAATDDDRKNTFLNAVLEAKFHGPEIYEQMRRILTRSAAVRGFYVQLDSWETAFQRFRDECRC